MNLLGMSCGWALGLCVSLTLPVRAALFAPAQPATSDNGKFVVDVSATDEPGQVLVAAQSLAGGVKAVVWSKKAALDVSNGAGLSVLRSHVSNDGRAVILYYPSINTADKWVWVGQAGQSRRFVPVFIERILGKGMSDSRFSTSMVMGAEGIFEFMFDAQGVYALWFATADKWLVIDLKSGEMSAAPSPLLPILNAEARKRALARIRQHQPGALKAMLAPARDKLAELVPGVTPSPNPAAFRDRQLFAAYIYLAMRKDLAVEKYLRGLLEYPFPRSTYHFAALTIIPFFGIRSAERYLGDLLMQVWNGLPVEPEAHGSSYLPNPRKGRQTRYLGVVHGRIKLPMVVPPQRPGSVWVYLIPAEIDAGDWTDEKEVIALAGQLDWGGLPANQIRQFDQLDYEFQTVVPGTYRVKAVWDRRPPLAQPGGRAVPEPGDYESAESEPFTVEAGAALTGPTLECIIKVGEPIATAWFNADAAWKKLHPTPIARPVPYRLPDEPRMGAVSYTGPPTPLSRWNVRTNLSSPNIRLRHAALVRSISGAPLEREELQLALELDQHATNLVNVRVSLEDEHEFRFGSSTEVRRLDSRHIELVVRAPVFPRATPITLEIRTPMDGELVAAYTLTNPEASYTHRWTARPLPITRSLPGGHVQLSKLSRRTGPVFKFDAKSSDSTWTAGCIVYEDSEGNRSFSPDDFCRRHTVIRLKVPFERSVRAEGLRRIQLPFPQLPEAGKFNALNVKRNLDGIEFELLAVTGTGEFDFADGAVRSVAAEPNINTPPATDSLPRIAPGEALRVFVAAVSHAFPGGVTASHGDRVIARSPCLILRIRGLQLRHRWALLEEAAPRWHSSDEVQTTRVPESEPWYLPINPGTLWQSGQFTLVVDDAIIRDFTAELGE